MCLLFRCAHCTTRPNSVLHLLGPGAVLLGDRLDALQHNSSFVRNNSWPKKVCSPYLYKGGSSLRIPKEASSNEFVDLHAQSQLIYESRRSHSPFQSISELQVGQHWRNSNSSAHHCFPSPKQLKRSSLNLQCNDLPPHRNSTSNISLGRQICNYIYIYIYIRTRGTCLLGTSVFRSHKGAEMKYSLMTILDPFHWVHLYSSSAVSIWIIVIILSTFIDEITYRIQSSTPNLTNSPLLRVKQGHRLEGVDGQQFKGRMSSIESWFNEFSDVQRNVVLKKLFPLFTPAQIQLLVTTMEPFIDPFCMHNCQVSDSHSLVFHRTYIHT